MKLCVNYLEEVRELIEEGKIDYIDYIKLFSINGDLSPLDWCITKKDVKINVNELTPIEALNVLVKLKEKL